MLGAFSKQLIKKYNIEIQNRNFEVRIFDNYFNTEGFFLVKIWEGKKHFLAPPDIQFDGMQNPIPLIENAILNYISREEDYKNTLRQIKEN